MEQIDFVYEDQFNDELNIFFMNEWPSANKEVFNFTDQKRWKMKEYIITAKKNGEILGVAQFRIIGGVGYLSTLLVKKEYRGQGVIGGNLLSQFEDKAAKDNCHKLSLKSYKNSQSSNFFADKGYLIEGVLKNDIHGIDWEMFAKFLDKTNKGSDSL